MKSRSFLSLVKALSVAALCAFSFPSVQALPPTVTFTPPALSKVRVMVRENNLPVEAASKGDDAFYTHTAKKTLFIALVNLTPQTMEITVKTTFLAKDEVGHDIEVAKTVETKNTVMPGKPLEFATEEVSFQHMSAHKPKGPPPVKTIPASGQTYFGYKVEVFQGADLVGGTASATH